MNCSPTALLNITRAFVPSFGIWSYVALDDELDPDAVADDLERPDAADGDAAVRDLLSA